MPGGSESLVNVYKSSCALRLVTMLRLDVILSIEAYALRAL